MADFRTAAGKARLEPGTSCLPESKEMLAKVGRQRSGAGSAGCSGAGVRGDLNIKLTKDPDGLQVFMLVKDTYLHSRSIDGSMERVADGDTDASIHTNMPTNLHTHLPT